MNNKNESLLELALKAMSKKRKPYTLNKIAEEAFELKGEKMTPEKFAQFKMDFMLSGYFICCGDDKDQHKLWDLKSRQPSSLLDKDGSYLDDLYNDDEDVIKNELTDDTSYKAKKAYVHEFDADDIEDDEDEDIDEPDDIEEELGYLDDEDDADLDEDELDDEDIEEDEEMNGLTFDETDDEEEDDELFE